MNEYLFIGCNKYDQIDFDDLDRFVNSFPDFESLILNSDAQLILLFEALGISSANKLELGKGCFTDLWDLSDEALPEFNKEEFDSFYNKWLSISKRENNMDEYGSLIFLQGMSQKWNKMKYRFVIKIDNH